MEADPATEPQPDPTPDPNPAPNADPAPDTAAALAAANEAVRATTDAFRSAVQQQNPDLPDNAFAGDDVATIQANIESARSVIEHADAYRKDNVRPPATPPGAGGERQRPQPPAGLKGPALISWSVNNPGKGTTEA